MKLKFARSSFLFLLILLHLEASNAVTYTFSGGRFGDNLLAYMHAKWVAYRYDLRLLYKPFPYSDQLVLHNCEEPYADIGFSHKRSIRHLSIIQKESKVPFLYTLRYFPESEQELSKGSYPDIRVDWEDPEFISLLRSLIQPRFPFTPLVLPENRVSVALHIRRGGGFDSPLSNVRDPLRFPPLDFYKEGLKKLYQLLENLPLYVHIFTDDLEPQKLIDFFQNELIEYDMIFAFRKDAGVLEDFFAMQQFTYLIRPDSNFSITAEKLGNFQIIIYPVHFRKARGKITIDQVKMIQKGEKCECDNKN